MAEPEKAVVPLLAIIDAPAVELTAKLSAPAFSISACWAEAESVKVVVEPETLVIVALPALLVPWKVMVSPAVKFLMMALPAVLLSVKTTLPSPVSVVLVMVALPAVLVPWKVMVPAPKSFAMAEFPALPLTKVIVPPL